MTTGYQHLNAHERITVMLMRKVGERCARRNGVSAVEGEFYAVLLFATSSI